VNVMYFGYHTDMSSTCKLYQNMYTFVIR